MQGFQYQHGDRPLEGFTLQRAVGRGGFGEVYYALSDSGREVALKCVQGHEQIELRGIRQCMNLKSPYLVTIFDVKYNDQDRPFVVMEYVAGPSLRDLLDESPSGLGAQKAAFFLREIGKGLTYLHDRGIVHRDLKPGNIFYEDGYVKIGDYGLSKAMTASQHSGQTVTVGTVHYMAPEIGQGRYDRGIDIYALGVVLYEMLTGQVPFFGASPGEILMKHMADEPDLADIDEPFATVIRRAMAKDPSQRYQTVQEMVEAVFGAEHVRQSVSHFRPESLSAVAERIGQKVGAAGGPGRPGSSAEPTMSYGPDLPPGQGSSNAWRETENWWEDFGQRIGQWGERMGQWGSRFGREVAHRAGGRHVRHEVDSPGDIERRIAADAEQDPMRRRQRRLLALTAAVLVAVGIAVIAPFPPGADPGRLVAAGLVFLVLIGAPTGVFLARYRLKVQSESALVRRLAYGGLACFFALTLAAPTYLSFILLGGRLPRDLSGSFIPIFVALLVVNWQRRTSPGRPARVSLGSAIGAGVVGMVAALIFGGDMAVAGGILAGVSLVVQVASPFDPKAAREWEKHRQEMKRFWNESGARAGTSPDRAGVPGEPPSPGPAPPPPRAGPKPAPSDERRARHHRAWPRGVIARPVPPFVRPLALLGFMLLLALGVVMLVWGAVEGDEDLIIGVCVGVGSLLLAFFCLGKAFQSTFRSWWSSLVKPLLMLGCIECVLIASMCLGFFDNDSEQMLVLLFLIVFAGLLFFVVAVLPNAAMHALFGGGPSTTRSDPVPLHNVSTRRRLWALLLSFAWFAGIGGLHRFYVGKVGTGLLWLVTYGLCGFGQIYDMIMIALGRFTDRHGLPLIIWHSENELRRSPPPGTVAGLGGYQGRAEVAAPGPAADGTGSPRAAEPGPPPSQQAAPSGLASRADGPIEVTGILLSMIGGFLLSVAFIVGLAVAADLPRIVAAGLPDEGVARELERAFGYRGWPRLVQETGIAAAVVLAFMATGCLAVARRQGGVVHIARAVLGSFGFLFALYPTLYHALQPIRWDLVAAMINDDQVGPAVQMILDAVHREGAIKAGAIFLASIVVLVWPARKRAAEPASQAGQEA